MYGEELIDWNFMETELIRKMKQQILFIKMGYSMMKRQRKK